jgi:competence protein ComEC
MLIIQPILQFWLSHPALLYGMAFMLGVFGHLTDSFWLLIPCLFLWIPFLFIILYDKQFLKHLLLSIIVFLSAWIYATAHHPFPSIPLEGVKGVAWVKIKNISLQTNFFGKNWLYRCEIEQFMPEGTSTSIVSSLPCLITLPAEDQIKQTQRVRPLANQEYWVMGKLTETAKGSYRLRVSSKAQWDPIPGTWSWAEQRYGWKKRASEWIESQFSHPFSASFLAGLVTGEFDDQWMRQQFSRFGLQHLLAISGFHFAIIASFLSFVLSLFLPARMRVTCLLFCLAAYCFFLGAQASILRAWIMCSLTLVGILLEKQTTALNSLGFALLAILGYNPLLCQELGFQLSFGTTAAILLFYSPAQWLIDEILPKRGLSEVLKMNLWNQHAYCVLAFLRQGFALTVAVTLFALPMTLYYFQQFPWMSLLYNLFYPFLASGSMCLFLLGSLLTFIPFLAHFIHFVNDHYTFFLLQLAYQIPSELDAYFKIEPFHPAWLIVYLCLVSVGGIIWKEKSSQDQKEVFQFI